MTDNAQLHMLGEHTLCYKKRFYMTNNAHCTMLML